MPLHDVCGILQTNLYPTLKCASTVNKFVISHVDPVQTHASSNL